MVPRLRESRLLSSRNLGATLLPSPVLYDEEYTVKLRCYYTRTLMVFRFFDLCGKKFGDFGSAQSLHCDMRVRILGSMILDSRISICSVGVDNRVNVKHLYLTIIQLRTICMDCRQQILQIHW